jgi:hypothetical protein
MAGSALGVPGEAGEFPVTLEFVAEGAVGAKMGSGIDARFGIHVQGMGELEENGARSFVARERNQVGRTGGWKSCVALLTDPPIHRPVEIVAVTNYALAMPRSFEDYRALFHRDMAQTAFERPPELVLMESVEEEIAA